jgi:hypothetical protein
MYGMVGNGEEWLYLYMFLKSTIVDMFGVIYTVAMLNHTISRATDAIEAPLS